MAVRVLQLCLVFTIGYHLAPAATVHAVATEELEIPLSLHLQDPKDVIVARGQPATLKCKIERFVADTSIRIRWLYNDAHIPLNDSRWTVQDDGSLYIPKVAGKRVNSVEGAYRCHVKNEFGALISGAAVLKIAVLGRKFVEEPFDVNISVGQPVVLPCKIHSFPGAVVTWERDKLPLPHNTTRYVPLPTGALLITSTHSSDAGFYRCKIMNCILMKTKYSSSGRLDVVSPDHAVVTPDLLPLGVGPNVTALLGRNLTLYCVVGGRPVPAIHWMKNGSTIVGNSSLLVLRNVTAKSSGDYTCSDKEGRVFQSYHVEIQQAPYFNVTPVSIRYPSSRTLRLPCQANGIPKPKIHWLVNGTRLEYDFRKREHPTGLVISHSFSTDAGLYQCIAENSVGRIWAAAQLVSMFLTRPPPPTNVRCRSFDDNSICLRWTTPSSVVPNAYSVYSYYAGKMGPEFITNYTYQLANNLNTSTNYTFYVRLYSKEASDQSQNVTCETGTNGERNLQVQIKNDTIELTWSEISSDVTCNDVRSNYRVQWKRVTQAFSNVDYVNGFKYVITDVEPLVTYRYRVTSATYENENGKWVSCVLPQRNNVIHMELHNETEPTAPYNLSAEVLTSDSVNLSWSSTNPQNRLFSICVVNVKADKDCDSKEHPVSRMNHIKIRKLKPSTGYEFKIRSHSDDGQYSSYSRAIEIHTFQEGPGVIRDLKYRVVNSTTVCLKWRAPYIKGGKLIRYIILYTSDKNTPVDDWHSTNITASMRSYRACSLETDDTLSVLLSHLDPNTYYTVTVKGDNATVINPASPITLSTKELLKYPKLNVDEVNMEEIYFKQKLGFVLGIVISLASVICFASCLVFRKYWLKKRALSRARIRTNTDVYVTNAATTQESSQESQEMQNLISANGTSHLSPTFLDTKGGANFPNRHTNGVAKHAGQKGFLPNGHVHITENPRVRPDNPFCNLISSLQFYVADANSYKEDSNSNLQNSKLRKSRDYEDDCNEDDLNSTQLTYLDDSILTLPSSYRKISVPLGPNG